ncbi:MAG: hypothetical protein YYHSYBAR_000580 [Candidatus Fervidibacter sacchari]
MVRRGYESLTGPTTVSFPETKVRKEKDSECSFSGWQCPCTAEKVSAHQEMCPPVSQPALAGFVASDWEGEVPAEPKR